MKQLYIYFLLFVSITFQNCINETTLGVPDHSFSGTGIASSTARFAIVGDFLYVVSNSSLKTFNVSTPTTPVFSTEIGIGTDIETIFPFAGKLFIGSQTGMFIFNIGTNGTPELISSYEHIEACDPVTTNGQYAYITLRTDAECRISNTNELQILDITDILNPTLVSTYPMGNPYGVGVSGNTLFVCDLQLGFTVLDVTDPLAITQIAQFPFYVKDVIVLEDSVLLISSTKLYQYDYSDLNNISLISTFNLY